MTETIRREDVWTICEVVAEAQAALDDFTAGAGGNAEALVGKLHGMLSEPGLLRAMWEVGYFPPTTPPADAML